VGELEESGGMEAVAAGGGCTICGVCAVACVTGGMEAAAAAGGGGCAVCGACVTVD
jgi:hypothetical protein